MRATLPDRRAITPDCLATLPNHSAVDADRLATLPDRRASISVHLSLLAPRRYTQALLDSAQKSDYVQMQAVSNLRVHSSLLKQNTTELILLAPSVGASNTYPMTTDKLNQPDCQLRYTIP